jgi:cell division septation protein DedD
MKRILTMLLLGMSLTILCAAKSSSRDFTQQGGTPDSGELSVTHLSLVSRIIDCFPIAAMAIDVPLDGIVPVFFEQESPLPESEPEPEPEPPEPEPDPPPQEPEPVPPPPSPPKAPPKPVPDKPPARIIPSPPVPGSTTLYRVQVGSFLQPQKAEEAFDRLVAEGLYPAYEQFGKYTRVVIPGILAAHIPLIAQRLGNLDVKEIWIRPVR